MRNWGVEADARESEIDQPQRLASSDHGLAAEPLIQRHQVPTVLHRKGDQVGIGERTRLQEPVGMGTGVMEQAHGIGPEAMVWVMQERHQQRRDHRGRPWRVGVARLPQGWSWPANQAWAG
jgi:hypothetical protein